ncbi:coiled-coil domain-containing protein 60-like isoform X1 [Scyliorhinus canicula]|uniref:coiled-coil domain-containing protein 60-like isoform X1 n=2 Tax=Scyliorhinus canicula TaxID=7830 RepID=UPI0018F463D7|nr:coiled-coil domain-containing protein 60-like isoform X1 [Scyliorhinus canicula]
MPTGSKVLEPRNFVVIKPLPFPPSKGLKVKARSLTVYSPCEPSRQQIFRENYRRRQDQLNQQGYRSVCWKPYQAIGQPLHLEPRQLILHSLGQLDQTANDEPNSTAEEIPEETKSFTSPMVSKDNKMFAAKLLHLKYKEKDLKTIRKDLSHTRQLVNTAKRGQGFFKRLKREEEEKQSVLLMEQKKLMEKRSKELQPPKFSSDEESEEEQEELKRFFVTEPVFSPRSNAVKLHSRNASSKRKVPAARPYTPLHCSLVSTRLTERDSEPLFRQLCALTWLLEAVTVEPPSTMGTVTTCWSARDPGGMKNTARKINKDKFVETRWEQFITQPKFIKLSPRVMRRTSLRPRRTSLATISRGSDATPVLGSSSSMISTSDDLGAGTPAPVLESVSEVEDNDSTTSSSFTQSKQDQEEEEPVSDYLRKLFESVHQSIREELDREEINARNCEESSTAVLGNGKRNVVANYSTEQQTDLNKPQQRPKSSPLGLASESSLFVASKSSLSLEMQSKFIEINEEAALCLHDNLEALEKKRWETSKCKFLALDNIASFYTYSEDMQRSLQESKGDKVPIIAETWYSNLLSRVPEAVKENLKMSRILKRLGKFGERQSFRVRPHQFLKVLNGLRNWELCSPDICAAIEFMRDKVVLMPAEDYDSWLQLKLELPKRIQSAPPLR